MGIAWFAALIMQNMEAKWDPQAKAGFKVWGIQQFDPPHVLQKVRRDPADQSMLVSQTLLPQGHKRDKRSAKSPLQQNDRVPSGRSLHWLICTNVGHQA